MNSKRKLLASLALVGASGTLAWVNKNSLFRWLFLQNQNAITPAALASLPGENSCTIPTAQVEGPFYFKSPLRTDIREGSQGLRLHLRLQLTRGAECRAAQGALVEIWQCDAEGKYSGYPGEHTRDFWKSLDFAGIKGMLGQIHIDPTNKNTFLRGSQITDSNGVVEFVTIFPGWYEPRAPHIHVKAILSDHEQVDFQYYFEKELADQIYSTHPLYTAYGLCPYTVDNDLALKGTEKPSGVLLKAEWKGGDLLEVSAKIGTHSASAV